MTITLNAPYSNYAGGATVDDLDNATEAALVAQGRAVYVSSPGSVFYPLTPSETQQTRDLVARNAFTGTWRNLPASGVIMRVRITGTGSVSMDSATGESGAGTVTTAAYTASPVGTQIDDFAYPGDAARSIRFTLTGTAAVEVY